MEIAMEQRYNPERNSVSLGCIAASATFFLILSQFLILRVPDIVTNMFRPIIIAILFVEMMRRGAIRSRTRSVALGAALYIAFLLVFLGKFSSEEIRDGIGRILYLLMFFFIVGTPWTKKEIRFMLTAVFMGCLACAVVFMYSNDMSDFSQSEGIDILGITVNRNKNAYAFAIGSVLGLFYFLRNNGIVRVFAFFASIMIGYCLMYSQCRGAFFCAVAGILWFVIRELDGLRHKNINRYLVMMLLLVLFCIGSYFAIKNSPVSRLVDTESTSGRDEGIEHALDLFSESDTFSKIFGHGYLFEQENTEGAISHSVYTNYLLSTGLIGAGLIMLIYVFAFIEIRGSAAVSLLITASLRVFFELMDYYIYIPMILAFVIFRYSYGKKHRESCLFENWLRRPRAYRR